MSWPTPQDYNEAIQMPALCFHDAELKGGQPELSPLGLPRPITGAFASVYRLHCPGKDWAVRCFLRSAEDLQQRYEQLSKHMPKAGSAFTAGFEFSAQGIMWRGGWYPILKMEWIDGMALDQFIDHHLDNALMLKQLAERFKMLTYALFRNGVAHGDLQHGNILIIKEGLKMVDYDGMFVPEFAGSRATELGHANYQHPMRTAETFGPFLDNFSAWIIYNSINILTIDKTLWKQLNGGDECLLFRRSDYANPYTSYAFSLLEHHQSQEIVNMSRQVRTILRLPPQQVPNLGTQVTPFQDLQALPEPSLLKGTVIEVSSWSDGAAPHFARSDWPKLEYFQQVVQQPSMCFKDRELKRTQYTYESAAGRLGFVCKLKGQQRTLAVKCFLREQPDREIRYHEVKRNILTGSARQYFVDFEYQSEGIHTRGKWFPILKMEWIQGPTLDEYIVERLMAGDIGSVNGTIHKFRIMISDLERARIAHGDIEPRNIIVTKAGLKLVDYDNIYIDSLIGLKSAEFGEPLYQHPARSLHHFGPYLANFPAWVLDNTLAFLSIYPNTFHWGWQYIVERVRTEELYYAGAVSNPTVEPIVTVPIGTEMRARAHLMSLISQFPVEQVPPLVEDFSSNLIKRDALISSINQVLQRYGAP